MKRPARWNRRIRLTLATGLLGCVSMFGGCWDSDIAKRFREAYGPGLVEGLSDAITNPAQSQLGFRRTATALFEGLGAIIQPRTSAGSGGSSGPTGSRSSGSS